MSGKDMTGKDPGGLPGDKDRDKEKDGDKPRVRLVPLARTPAPATAPAASNLKPPLLAPSMRPLTPPAGGSRFQPLVPGVPGVPGLQGVPGVRPAFVRPVAHPLLRGLAKPRPAVPLLGSSLPSLRPTGRGIPPLVAGLPKGGLNANTASLLAGMAGMDETANAELDGIREALLQAEATEQYLAARQEEIANALLAVAGASAAVPSLEALLAAAGGGGLPNLAALGAPAPTPELDEQTKALLQALTGAAPAASAAAAPAAPAPTAALGGLEALLAVAAGAGGAGGGAGGLEALLAAAVGGGGAAAEALLSAAAGGGGANPTEALLLAAAGAASGPAAAAPAATPNLRPPAAASAVVKPATPSPPTTVPPPEPAAGGEENELDDMTKALLAAAGVDANAQGSDDVTQALLAAAVSNSAAVTAAADGKEDEITKALLAAAQTKQKDGAPASDRGPPGPPEGEPPAASEKMEKPPPDAAEKKEAVDKLSDLAATANVPEEMTKALLAAVATNTPSAAGDADRIIKAVLRAATASMSESSEPAPFAGLTEDKKASDQLQHLPPQSQAKAAAEAPKKEPDKPAQRPQGSMVSTEFLRAMEENAKASARTSAAKSQVARQPTISFSIGPAAKKPKTEKTLEDEEADKLNQQLLEQHEATKAWVFFGKIPKGTSEGLIRTECAKYGTVTSILYNAEPDSLFEEPWALVSLASLESAAKAVDRLNSRLSLFGGSQQVEVRMGTPEDLEKWQELIKAEEQVRVQPPPPPVPVMAPPLPMLAPVVPVQETQLVAAPADPAAPAQGRQKRHEGRKKKDRSVDSRGSDGRGGKQKKRKGESRSDSRSGSRDPPPLPVVQRKVYGLGGFDNASVDADKKTPRATAAEASLVMAPSGDRRIGTRGSWAEFVTREWEYYYVNIHTGEKRWMLPVAEMRGVAPRRSS